MEIINSSEPDIETILNLFDEAVHAKEMNKKYLRMDTWGNNETIKDYYIQCGFNYIGQQQLTKTEE